MVTQSELKKLLDYDPETGVFTWRVNPSIRAQKGSEAGHHNKLGYISIRIGGKMYQAHRLAWLITHGEWPAEIDHINHIKVDNRLANLRNATREENCRNNALSSNNTSGVCGVYWNKTKGKWVAQIMVNRKAINLGAYESIDEAARKREMANILYGFHPNHGAI